MIDNSNSVTIFVEDIELEVYYTISKAIKGAKGSYGEPLEPDEPATLDVTGIYLIDKSAYILDLFNISMDEVEEKIREALSNGD
jgi:hypothetical protein